MACSYSRRRPAPVPDATCGVTITSSRPSRECPTGNGSGTVTSSPAPARWPRSSASSRASWSTNTPRAQLTRYEPGFIRARVSALISRSVDASAGRVQRHDVGERQHRVECHESDAGYRRLLDEWIGATTIIPRPWAAMATRLAMRPSPTSPKRRAVELERLGGHRARQPGRGAGLQHRHVLGDGEHQRDRVLGGRHGRRLRGVADDDAGGGGVGEVHVVVADAGSRHDAEPWARREHRSVPLAMAAGDRRRRRGRCRHRRVRPRSPVPRSGRGRGREARRRRRAPGVPYRPSSADRSAHPIVSRCSGSVARRRPFLFPMSDEQLDRYRASIDNIDAALVHLLAERFKITKAVGEYKARVGLPPADLEREAAQIARASRARRRVRARPDVHREVPAVHRRRGDPPSPAPQRARCGLRRVGDRRVTVTVIAVTERFDIVVIGAGPAGAATAIQAARGGARVLVVDAAAHGRDKVCGDGLTPRAVAALQRPRDPARRRPPHRRPAHDRRQARRASCRGRRRDGSLRKVRCGRDAGSTRR